MRKKAFPYANLLACVGITGGTCEHTQQVTSLPLHVCWNCGLGRKHTRRRTFPHKAIKKIGCGPRETPLWRVSASQVGPVSTRNES